VTARAPNTFGPGPYIPANTVVGVVGIGNMGAGMANSLLRAGYRVRRQRPP
jgi:hypothetical protein